MARAPKNNSKNIKSTDGRKHNKRLPSKVEARGGLTKKPARLNDSKKERVSIYAVNALKKVFGGEAEAWEFLAEKSKESHADRKLLWEHAYGKPTDGDMGSDKDENIAPVINFITTGSKANEEEVIDITAEEVTDDGEGDEDS